MSFGKFPCCIHEPTQAIYEIGVVTFRRNGRAEKNSGYKSGKFCLNFIHRAFVVVTGFQ